MKKLFVILIGLIALIAGFYYLSPTVYHNWPKEKKQAYQFYLLERKLISHPELLSKISVFVQKDSHSFYDSLSPSEVGRLSSFPPPYEVVIEIPYKKWNDWAEADVGNYLFSHSEHGLGCWSSYSLFCRSNKNIGEYANVRNTFNAYYHEKLMFTRLTPYGLDHQVLRGDEDQLVILAILEEANKTVRNI